MVFLSCVSYMLAQPAFKTGDSLYALGNYSKAIEQYLHLESKEMVYPKIANSYRALGNFDEALKYYEKSIQSDPNNALIKYDLATLLVLINKFEMAQEVLLELIVSDKNNPNYHYQLGLVLEEARDSTAIESYKTAFALDSTHQKAVYKIARDHMIKRRHDEANHIIDIGLKSYANNLSLINIKAQNYFIQRKYEQAKLWFEKLVGMGESSKFIQERLSQCYTYLSDYKKALDHLNKALEFEPNNAQMLYQLGNLYFELNDFEAAENFVLKALELWDIPLDKEFMKLGTIYNYQKKSKSAIDAFQHALQENPNNDHIHFLLLLTQNNYYKDTETRIKLFENFFAKFPESIYLDFLNTELSKLKSEQFLEDKD